MIEQPPIGLMVAGMMSDSFLARIPEFLDALGPVKSTSYRVASRISNRLRAGTPVKTFEDLRDTASIFLWMPDKVLESMTKAAVASTVNWKGKCIVLCDSWQNSHVLAEFQARGAAVASWNVIPGLTEPRFVMEGEARALREIKRLTTMPSSRFTVIPPASKARYFASLTLSTDLMLPVISAAAESLRSTGMPHALASSVLETWMHATVRSYARSGRKAFNGPISRGNDAMLRAELHSIAAYPKIERTFREAAKQVHQRFGGAAHWLSG